MTPTIGRSVHYHLPDHDPRSRYEGDVLPATVTRVWSDTCVNLKVICEAGDFLATSVVFDESGAPGHWSWPPRAGLAKAA